MKKHVKIEKTEAPLKIGILLDTSFDAPDGVQQYVQSIGVWLAEAGHDVHYLVGQTTRTDIPNIHNLSKNFSVSFNGNKMTIPLWAHRRAVRRLLAEQRFDILHVQSPHHPLMAQYVIHKAGSATGVVSTFHILPYNKLAAAGTWLLGRLLATSLRRIDVHLAVSRTAADFAKKCFKRPYKVLPNVFDYLRFKNAKPLAKYDDDVLTILFLGRLVERKGCQYLLEAITKLDKDSLPAFRVVVCGKGEQLLKLQQYCKLHELTDVVEFAGFVSESDKPRYYASADISVFPSTAGESFGIVLIEAMASGNSVVLAGDNPGYATVMEAQTDRLFIPTDTDVLAELLRKTIQNHDQRQTDARHDMNYVAKFDVNEVGPQLIEQYKIAIAKRNK